jgi:outer membrane biosynthesis protein TonB
MTEEELIEGFLSRLTGATGTLVGKVKRGVKSAGSTWEDMKKQYHRGVAGELTWTGAEKYPSDEDSSKTEKTEEEPTAEKKTRTPKPKVSPEQKNKLATDPRHDALRKRREARKQSGDDLAMSLRQRLQSKGLISDKGKKTEAGKAAATNVKDKAAAISAKTKETIVNKKRGAAYSKCIEKGGDEKKCMKYASSIMASKEYYSDLRKRLLENYKK